MNEEILKKVNEALRQSDKESFKALLENKEIDPNYIAPNKIDLLSFCMVQKRYAFRDLLLKHGASPNHPHSVAWECAIYQQSLRDLKLLCHRFSFEDHLSPFNQDPVSISAFKKLQLRTRLNAKNFKIVELLLKKGLNPNIRDSSEKPFVEFFLNKSFRQTFEVEQHKWLNLFLKNGLNPNQKLSNGDSLIHFEGLSAKSIEVLLDFDADASLPSRHHHFMMTLAKTKSLLIAKKAWKNGGNLYDKSQDESLPSPLKILEHGHVLSSWRAAWSKEEKERLDKTLISKASVKVKNRL